ncbi:MAG TPA: transporter [Myxococcaceae bacterium]|nr:transporter [Myxococcaceae bacterium]
MGAHSLRWRGLAWGGAVASLLLSTAASAQLSGDLFKGEYGLTSGTQPPPGLVLTPWLYDSYSTTLMGPDGQTVDTSGASTNVLAVPGLALWLVSPWEVLGANYGAQLQLWGTTPSRDFPALGGTSSTYGFGDMYLKPLELGWHAGAIDVITGFALWIPTGRYSPGASNNTGQGQWGYELSAGATLWFDALHQFNFAMQALYDIYSPRRGAVTVGTTSTQLQTGNILYLQGGLGFAPIGRILNIGIPYFVQFKITEDTLPPGAGTVLPGIQAAKSWAIGLGAEVDLSWTPSDRVVFRWVQGFAGANTTNGASFLLSYSHTFFVFGEEP